MLSLLIIFLNIAYLGWLSVKDIKTHSAPFYATFFYIVGSLAITNFSYFAGATCIAILMFAIDPIMKSSIGPADKKILFGLTLQLGWTVTIVMFGIVLFALFWKKATQKSDIKQPQPIPLIPFILIGYILWVFYAAIATGLVI